MRRPRLMKTPTPKAPLHEHEPRLSLSQENKAEIIKKSHKPVQYLHAAYSFHPK